MELSSIAKIFPFENTYIIVLELMYHQPSYQVYLTRASNQIVKWFVADVVVVATAAAAAINIARFKLFLH